MYITAVLAESSARTFETGVVEVVKLVALPVVLESRV
jgi:hypothetical protein